MLAVHAQRPAGLFWPDGEIFASRVQGLAASRSIVVTESVVENAHARALLRDQRLKPTPRRVAFERHRGQGVGLRDFLSAAVVEGSE